MFPPARGAPAVVRWRRRRPRGVGHATGDRPRRQRRPREPSEAVGSTRAATAPPATPERRGAWGPYRGPHVKLVHPLVVEAGRALDARVAAGDVLLLQLLEVAHAGHHVVALGRVAVLGLLQTPLSLLLVLHELLHRVPHGVHAGVGGEERDEDELVAQLTKLLEGERVLI